MSIWHSWAPCPPTLARLCATNAGKGSITYGLELTGRVTQEKNQVYSRMYGPCPVLYKVRDTHNPWDNTGFSESNNQQNHHCVMQLYLTELATHLIIGIRGPVNTIFQ